MIGSRLTHIRGALSQGEMAKRLGVHKNTYARWERDEAEIGAAALAGLARDGWNINWLLTGEGPEQLVEVQASGPSQPVRLDGAMMGRALATVRRLLAENGLESSAEGEGELAAILYEMYQDGYAWAAAERSVAALMRTSTSAIRGKRHEQERS